MQNFQNLFDQGKFSEILDIASSFHTSESVYWQIVALVESNRVKDALDLISQTSFEVDYWQGFAYRKLGNHYFSQSQFDKSLIQYQKALHIFELIENELEYIESLIKIGLTHYFQGNLEKAFDTYERALLLSETEQDLSLTARVLNNLGEIYRARGELDHALLHYQRGANLAIDAENFGILAIFLTNMGEIFVSKGMYDKALEYYEKSRKYFKDIVNETILSYLIVSLIEVYLVTDNNDLVKPYLDVLRNLCSNNEGNERIHTHYEYCIALVYKSSNRIKDKVRAQEYFEKVIDTNSVDFELTIKSMNHLIELLVYEYRMYEQDIVLQEITDLSKRMYKLAKKQSRYVALIDVLLIQSRLAMFENNFEYANLLLTQALIMAEEKGMIQYAKHLEQEIATLENNLNEMQKILQSSSIAKKLEQAELLDYLRRARQVGDTFDGFSTNL